jgi:CBS domain-containing protein
MANEVLMLSPEADITEALNEMQDVGVRRAPVVDEDGTLVGILALDDIIEIIAEDLLSVVELMERGQLREQAMRA